MARPATVSSEKKEAEKNDATGVDPEQTAPQRAIEIPAERHGNQGQPAARALLMRVCAILGVNPNVNVRPVELLTWTFYRGDPANDIPDAVSIVTAGGRKLKVFADDTIDEDTIGMLGRAFRLKPHPDGSPWLASELPEDLTLPTVEVTGMTLEQGHIYAKGYLKSGGKAEASRRQALRKKAGA